MARLGLGVLISGRGSNLQALIDASAQADYPAEIRLVISNEAEVEGLARAMFGDADLSGFVQKPFRRAQLARFLRNVLGEA